MRHRLRYLDHDGVRLRFRVEGGGPAIVLIHGWALDMGMWEPQFSALARTHLVIALDRRGFGESSGQPGIEDDVRDIRYLLDTLVIRRAAIVGMSQGARVALRYTSRYPEGVSCLVLDGPPQETVAHEQGAADELPMADYRDLVRRQGIAAFRKLWLRHPFMQLRTSNPDTVALLRKIIGRYPGHDLMSAESAYPPIVHRLSSMTEPTLVINGEHDSPRRRQAGDAMSHSLPHSQRALVPDAGHLPNLDNPVAYNEFLSGFLRAYAAAPLPQGAIVS